MFIQPAWLITTCSTVCKTGSSVQPVRQLPCEPQSLGRRRVGVLPPEAAYELLQVWLDLLLLCNLHAIVEQDALQSTEVQRLEVCDSQAQAPGFSTNRMNNDM